MIHATPHVADEGTPLPSQSLTPGRQYDSRGRVTSPRRVYNTSSNPKFLHNNTFRTGYRPLVLADPTLYLRIYYRAVRTERPTRTNPEARLTARGAILPFEKAMASGRAVYIW
jgi:hypothetical protein